MAKGGKILSTVLKELAKEAKPGITTYALEELANELIVSMGAKPSFKGYNDFPTALCISIDDEVVHGVPSDRVLKVGQLVKIDLGVLYEGYHTDSALTVLVGFNPHDKTHLHKMELMDVCREALQIGIEHAVVGNTTGDLGNAIEKYVKSKGFDVVKDLVGHGIGKSIHESPEVANYGKKKEGDPLRPGMVIAIEPMVVTGADTTEPGEDGFAYKTIDGGLAVHFEHTVAVTPSGPLVLTQ